MNIFGFLLFSLKLSIDNNETLVTTAKWAGEKTKYNSQTIMDNSSWYDKNKGTRKQVQTTD